ncbi:MAG: uroporphyrinogen-III synthase [Crocinitomix sp.]
MSAINSILVTRKLGSFEKLEQWCVDQQILLNLVPFIKVEAVLNVTIPTTDWIFFSSPQGAQRYLKHYSIKAQKIAAIGQGTAAVLKKAGFKVEFIGKPTDDPEIIGQKFNALITNNSTVFFPISNRSKRSVINQINAKQIEERITYKTLDQQQELHAKFDVILFTSPSNFHSFAQSNNIPSNTHLIAMGKTTENAIRTFNPTLKVNVLEAPTESAIIAFLEKLV